MAAWTGRTKQINEERSSSVMTWVEEAVRQAIWRQKSNGKDDRTACSMSG